MRVVLDREGPLFHAIYHRRTTCERINSQAQALGIERPKVRNGRSFANLNTLIYLVINYYKQKRYAEAEPLLKQALTIDREIFGPDHPDVAIRLTDLARLYHDLGKNSEAELLFQRALTIREQALGPTALAVANSLRFLAEFYRAQGNNEAAEPRLKRAVTIVRQILPPTSPLRSIIVREYSDFLQKMGQTANAKKLVSQEK